MRLVLAILLASRLAHADTPPTATPDASPATQAKSASDAAPRSRFVVLASTGIGTASIGESYSGAGYYSYGDRGTVQTLHVDLGARVDKQWMVGLHVGVASSTNYTDGWSDFMGTDESQYAVRTIQYGITAHYAVNNRVWLAPFLGVQDSMRREECYLRDTRYPRPPNLQCMPVSDSWEHHFDLNAALGFSAGLDVLEHDGHRLSLVGSFVLSKVTPVDDTVVSYSNVSLELAYRFWQ